MPINKGLGGFCFLKSVKDEILTYFIVFFNFFDKQNKKIFIPYNR